MFASIQGFHRLFLKTTFETATNIKSVYLIPLQGLNCRDFISSTLNSNHSVIHSNNTDSQNNFTLQDLITKSKPKSKLTNGTSFKKQISFLKWILSDNCNLGNRNLYTLTLEWKKTLIRFAVRAKSAVIQVKQCVFSGFSWRTQLE